MLKRWVGIKCMVYDKVEAGKTVVNIEHWIDEKGDGLSWVKKFHGKDDGTWAGPFDACGLSATQQLLWGGPYATFRWDTATDVDFKNLSVREIVVP